MLERWVSRRKSTQALAQCGRIILACATGRSSLVVVAALRVTLQTVRKWRAEFSSHRLDSLVDEPRPGAPRQIMDADLEAHDYPNAGIHPAVRYLLGYSLHRQGMWVELKGDQSDVVQRFFFYRESERCCGVVFEAAESSFGVVCG